MGKRVTTPLLLGGQFSVGNAASIPDGYVRALNNHLTRPGRLPARPPFVYDNLMAINGLCNFDDTANRVRRLLAINTSQQVFEKATSGETWGGANATTISGTRLTDSADYRGITYMMFDDGAGLPSGVASFDGTAISKSPLKVGVTLGQSLKARTVTTYDERLYFAYLRATLGSGVSLSGLNNTVILGIAYDWTTGTTYGGLAAISQANVTAAMVSIGTGSTSCRLSATSLAASACNTYWNTGAGFGIIQVSPFAAGSDRHFQWRFSARGVSATFDVPFTIEWLMLNPVFRNTAYLADVVVTPGNGFRYHCTTAGTTAVGAVAYNTVVNGTTTDGTAAFTCDGPDVLTAYEGTIPSLSNSPDYQTHFLTCDVPPAVFSVNVTPRLKFYNSTTTALAQLSAVDISLKDGVTDGDPRKANWGQQFTQGTFFYPFFNQESSAIATVDLEEVMWSEIGDPSNIRASNSYKLRESTGRPQAATTLGGRFLVAKRNAIWQFQDTGDPDIPIRREKFMAGIGITGPRAHDKFEDEWFFVGENDCYRYKVGDEIPKPFCGNGMRETVMAKGANWVESQSTYKRPLLAIDQQQLIVWIYTQKGKLFAYDLRSGRWSTHYTAGNVEIDAMIWNPGTGNFYVSFGGHGLTRMDYTSVASDTIDNTATPLALDKSFVLPPLKISTLRFDAYCEGIKMLYASANPSLQSVTASISYDQGATYPNSVNYTPFLSSTSGDFVPITLDICESGPSITLKVAASGPGGEGSWSLAEEMEMKLKINRGEFPRVNPTAGSSNL